MTTTRQQLEQADTIYIVSSSPYARSGARAYVLEQMSGYDTDVYRAAIASDTIDQVVQEEWENVWTQGDDVYLTQEVAEAEAEGRYETRNAVAVVVEITRGIVRAALLDAFGKSGD